MTDPLDGATGSPRPGRPDVVVVGSANLDYISRVSRALTPGETLLALEYDEQPGGKGLNQAVASAGLVATSLVGVVGDDEAGRALRAFAQQRGVDTTYLGVSDRRTGRAFVSLLPDGENTIVVAPEANAVLRSVDVVGALENTGPTAVLIQFEIPTDVVDAVREWAQVTATRLVVNPSPFRELGPDLLGVADPLIVNTVEALQLVGWEAAPERLAQHLSMSSPSVVVTAGSGGAFIGMSGEVEHVRAAPVAAVADTSGAGDHFAGTLVAHLARGASLGEATSHAVHDASRIVGLVRSDR
ncbi:PfkB family carbohydrate kinase [Microbacterium sp. ABRD28]|uniref:PfkB family carbohydrate kinase n=1 Tax=Microbacterium sp. ABRD28 TaxID=2268461 RepID=UPI0013DD97B8|nr:PfkB family carbohydrate kinase [Microbacterium sp. ABRD28]